MVPKKGTALYLVLGSTKGLSLHRHVYPVIINLLCNHGTLTKFWSVYVEQCFKQRICIYHGI